MEVKITTQDSVTTAQLIGRLDTPASQEISGDFENLTKYAAGTVILDCTQLEYISSSGLRLFLSLRKAAASKGGKVIVKAINNEIRRFRTDTAGIKETRALRLVGEPGSIALFCCGDRRIGSIIIVRELFLELRYGIARALLGTQLLQFSAGLYYALAARQEFLLTCLIGLAGILKSLANGLVSVHELAHAVHHLISQLVDLLVVLSLTYLGPCHVDYAQGGEQGLLIGYIDVFLHGVAPQVGLGLDGGPQGACIGVFFV